MVRLQPSRSGAFQAHSGGSSMVLRACMTYTKRCCGFLSRHFPKVNLQIQTLKIRAFFLFREPAPHWGEAVQLALGRLIAGPRECLRLLSSVRIGWRRT